MWALGDYPAVAAEIIPELGLTLVEAAGVRRGDRVLDVAACSGNAAIPAALAGASVVAYDLTPELFATGPGLGRAARREARVARGRRRGSAVCRWGVRHGPVPVSG